jgi:DNA-binding Lrp family transcriptional regulator
VRLRDPARHQPYGLPRGPEEHLEHGWGTHYWEPLKRYLAENNIYPRTPYRAIGYLSMPMAYVMMNVKVGTDVEVVKQLRLLKQVIGVFEVYSIYDIVTEVRTDTMGELEEVVNSKIRRLDNVLNTHTMIVAEKMSSANPQS